VKPWRFLNTGLNSGEINMRFDELLASRLDAGRGTQTVRIYRWKPWAVSLGYNQKAGDLDTALCAREGVDIVRRPTGGRAILHAEELTYSVVMLAERKSVLQLYNAISLALVRGLGLFGVDVTLQKSQPDFRSEYRQASSVPCFTSSARYEIEWKGRKLVGSAQRRFSDGTQDVVLQHGSILCGPAHRRLVEYIPYGDPAAGEKMRSEMMEKTVDLSEICGHAIDYEVLGRAIRAGFEQEWQLTFEDSIAEVRPEEQLIA
jgi:lipoate-protein ligase A